MRKKMSLAINCLTIENLGVQLDTLYSHRDTRTQPSVPDVQKSAQNPLRGVAPGVG